MQRQERTNPVFQVVTTAFAALRRPMSAAAAVFRRRAAPAASAGVRPQSAQFAKLDTAKWNLLLLKHMEWRRFEDLCAAYYEAAGYTTSVSGRANGEANITAYSAGRPELATLVRCKAWDAYRVGTKPVRELRAAMTGANIAEGVLLTSGRFTHEAVALAAKERIKLIDGAALLARIAELPPEKSAALLSLATQGDFLTPTCPSCAVKMTSRSSTGEGRKFWGCPNYPKCKQTLPATADAPA